MRIPQTRAFVATLLLLGTLLSGCVGSAGTGHAGTGHARTGLTESGSTETGPTERPVERAAATPGCAADARLHLCFSSPASRGGGDPTVVAGVRRIFEAAGEGDSLRIAMFRWDIPATADAVVAAQRRGAHVELVVDEDVAANPVGRDLLRTIENGDPTRRHVVVCKGACLPWRAGGPAPPSQDINHLKLILADIDGRQSVTTTSLNLEGRQYVQANSMLQMFDAGVYAYSLAYFQRLGAQSNLRWDDRDKSRSGTGGSPDVAVYPNRSDLLVSTLNRVRCAKGMNTVDVMHAVIQRYDVRAALGRLQRSGCRVRIVVTRDLIENWLEAPFRLPGGGTADIPDRDVKTLLTHDKVYAIHARWRGRETYMVVTGTSNATCGGLLYNDEMMVRLEGEWVWEQYRRHVARAFGDARQGRSSVMPVQAPCG